MVYLEIALLLVACLASYIAGGERGYRDGVIKVLRIIENDLKNTIVDDLTCKQMIHVIGTKIIGERSLYK